MARDAAAPAPIRSISHDAPLAPDPVTGSIPPYDLSVEWAGKPPQAIYDEIIRRRHVARATGQLLTHADMTLEFLWAESLQRQRRSPAEIAGEPTPDEQRLIDDAEAAYIAAERAWREAQKVRALGRGTLDVAVAQASAKRWDGGNVVLPEDFELSPSQKPDQVIAAERDLAARQAAEAAAYKASTDALRRLNAVRMTVMEQAGWRRRSEQATVNHAGLLANFDAAGVGKDLRLAAEKDRKREDRRIARGLKRAGDLLAVALGRR